MTKKNKVLHKEPIELSLREAEVLMWSACGKDSIEISKILLLSKETIRAQIKSACKKLNASNKTHATAIALSHGILTLGPSPKRVISLTTLFGLSKEGATATSLISNSDPTNPHNLKELL